MRVYLLDNPAFHLVVSSHARTGLSRIVFGSAAAAIVHHNTAPVLVVPRPDAMTGFDNLFPRRGTRR